MSKSMLTLTSMRPLWNLDAEITFVGENKPIIGKIRGLDGEYVTLEIIEYSHPNLNMQEDVDDETFYRKKRECAQVARRDIIFINRINIKQIYFNALKVNETQREILESIMLQQDKR